MNITVDPDTLGTCIMYTRLLPEGQPVYYYYAVYFYVFQCLCFVPSAVVVPSVRVCVHAVYSGNELYTKVAECIWLYNIVVYIMVIWYKDNRARTMIYCRSRVPDFRVRF